MLSAAEKTPTLLNGETANVLSILAQLRANQRVLSEHNKNVLMMGTFDLLDLVDNVQRDRRRTGHKLDRALGSNERLERENQNLELALAETNMSKQLQSSELAAVKDQNKALEAELLEYKKRFKAAKAEIQNATITNNNTAFALPPFVQLDDQLLYQQQQQQQGICSKLDENINISDFGSIANSASNVSSAPNTNSSVSNNSVSSSSLLPPFSLTSISSFAVAGHGKCGEAMFPTVRATSTPVNSPHPVSLPKEVRKGGISRLQPPRIVVNGLGNRLVKERPTGQRMLQPPSSTVAAHNLAKVKSALAISNKKCEICNRWIFGAHLECSECKIQLHSSQSCQQRVPHCVPFIPVPKREKPPHQLALLCPQTQRQPRVPGQLIHCVRALERLRPGAGTLASVVSMYTVPEPVDVRGVEKCFTDRKYKLDGVPLEAVAGYVKKFLRELTEPLITVFHFGSFQQAVADMNEEVKLKKAVEELRPFANRDTLAFLCVHWKKVAFSQTLMNKLARVLGPIVVGEKERASGKDVLIALLKLDNQFWTKFCKPIMEDQQQQIGSANMNITESSKKSSSAKIPLLVKRVPSADRKRQFI